MDWGGSGRPIVLLHGLSSNAYLWAFTAPILAKGFRVVGLDMRGHGLSAKARQGYDFPTMVGDVKAFVDALGLEKPIVVGHSWGGNVAMQFAVDFPDSVSGVVGVDGGIVDPSSFSEAKWEELVKELAPTDFKALDLTWQEFLQKAQEWRVSFYWGGQLETFLKYNFYVNRNGKVRSRLTPERHVLIMRSIWEQKISRMYPRVGCPALLIMAKENSERPSSKLASFQKQKAETVKLAAGILERCRVHWMHDTIHDVPVQRPKEVAGLIEKGVREGFFQDG